jgi:hypothetical protein
MLGLKPVGEGTNRSNLPTGSGRKSNERPNERERETERPKNEAIEAPIDCKRAERPRRTLFLQGCEREKRENEEQKDRKFHWLSKERRRCDSWYPVRGVRAGPGPETVTKVVFGRHGASRNRSGIINHDKRVRNWLGDSRYNSISRCTEWTRDGMI